MFSSLSGDVESWNWERAFRRVQFFFSLSFSFFLLLYESDFYLASYGPAFLATVSKSRLQRNEMIHGGQSERLESIGKRLTDDPAGCGFSLGRLLGEPIGRATANDRSGKADGRAASPLVGRVVVTVDAFPRPFLIEFQSITRTVGSTLCPLSLSLSLSPFLCVCVRVLKNEYTKKTL